MSDVHVDLWTRAVADPVFRDALIEDPLRALANEPQVRAEPAVVRRLEGMSTDERRGLVRELITSVMRRRARDQWGDRFWSPDLDLDPPQADGDGAP